MVTPDLTLPVGFTFYQPAPELSAWYKQDKALKKQEVPPSSGPRNRHPIHTIPPNKHSRCACYHNSRVSTK